MNTQIQLSEEPARGGIKVTPGCGAVVSFDGIVRGEEDGVPIAGLHYEAYQPMAERVIARILEELGRVHPFGLVCILHRIGFVPIGESAMRVDIHSKHRREAFALLSAFMDRFKQEVPIWKKVVH